MPASCAASTSSSLLFRRFTAKVQVVQPFSSVAGLRAASAVVAASMIFGVTQASYAAMSIMPCSRVVSSGAGWRLAQPCGGQQPQTAAPCPVR